MLMVLFPVYVILLVLGAKATWKLVLNIIPGASFDDFGGLVILIGLFMILFLTIGPIMGIVAAVKYFMLKVNSKTA